MSRIDDLIAEHCPHGVDSVPLGDLVVIKNGRDYKHLGDGAVPVYGSGGVMTHVDTSAHPGPSVLIPRKGSLNNIFYVDKPFWTVDTIFYTEIGERIDGRYLYYFLVKSRLGEMNQAGGVPSQTQTALKKISVPLPPLVVQREIVSILDQFTKLEEELNAELAARRRQYRHYQGELLGFQSPSPSVTWKQLGDIGPVRMCKRVFKDETSTLGDIPFFKIGTFGGVPDAYISRALYESYRARYPFPKPGEILISAAGTIGRTVVYDGADAYFQDSNIVWVENDESVVSNAYLKHWYRVIRWATDDGTIKRLYNNNILRARIAVPSRPDQDKIVRILDSFDELIDDPRAGLPAELRVRRRQYEYYRDKLMSFQEIPA